MKSRTSLFVFAIALLAGCGSGGHHRSFGPQITSLNGSTAASSPIGFLIEIDGFNFGSAPGEVLFTQGANAATLGAVNAWSNTVIAVAVPASGAGGAFTVPGTLDVTVVTALGSSNSVALALTPAGQFTPASLSWGATTPLPVSLTAHGAAAVPGTAAGAAFVFVVGGNTDGKTASGNVNTVLSATLDAAAAVGAWGTQTSAGLPPRAFHALAEADASSSPVASGSAYLYVICGEDASGAPTKTVFFARVDQTTGNIDQSGWVPTGTGLDAVIAPRAAVGNGFLHVTGGYGPDRNASQRTFSAPIFSDGSLGAFTQSPNFIPTLIGSATGVAFHQSLVFGGLLYVFAGENGNFSTPAALFETTKANLVTSETFFAPIREGVVGTWTAAVQMPRPRSKHALASAFGQVILAEGVPPTTVEVEASQIAATGGGQPGAWAAVGGSPTPYPGGNVYSAAAVTSPLLTAGGNPRFLLIGGQSAPGSPLPLVFRTTSP